MSSPRNDTQQRSLKMTTTEEELPPPTEAAHSTEEAAGDDRASDSASDSDSVSTSASANMAGGGTETVSNFADLLGRHSRNDGPPLPLEFVAALEASIRDSQQPHEGGVDGDGETATVAAKKKKRKKKKKKKKTTMTTVTATAAAATLATDAPPPSPPVQDPQDDECVLCAHPFKLKNSEVKYNPCCGERICMGCIIGYQRVLALGTNVPKPRKGSKEEEFEFMMIGLADAAVECPFCRVKEARSMKETIKRLWKRINKYNDPKAMTAMGGYYLEGLHGVSKNPKKAEELYKRAYDLGYPAAARSLGELYSNHISNPVLATKYLEEGGRRGSVMCMLALADIAHESENYAELFRLCMKLARFGDDEGMENVMEYYRQNLLSKDDLATTLRAHKAANDVGKSEPREYAMRYVVCLKANGGIIA